MTDAAAPLLRLSGISVRLGGRPVLESVDLSVAPGRIVTLVGPNGAGKSTLLRVALGLLAPDHGRVECTAHRVGYVPQRVKVERLMPLDVRRFLAAAAPGADPAPVLAQVGAGGLLRRSVADLSGGEMQRVLLARALLRRPDLLALDEPAAGIDVGGQAEMYDLIAGLAHAQGVGVLLVSHDLHVVMAATDLVICLDRRVCCSGPPATVGRHPDYLALFGARAAASLALYAHAHDHAPPSSGPEATDG
jgi:zinc transport system ATP-binding protein